jgi:16S rRNA (guanine527-N7)-methyltransferase
VASGRPLLSSADAQALDVVLADARERGFLGPGPVSGHVRHALGFAAAAGAPGNRSCALDLGSGAGIPGLVLALAWPDTSWALLEAHGHKAAFLEAAAARLALTGRVVVLNGRAEVLGHDPELRGAFSLAVARSFGRPSVTAECAAGFLAVGGRLVVSEPPTTDRERWSDHGLAQLGMRRGQAIAVDGVGHFQLAEQRSPCPPRHPRRVGVPAKRPLF